MQVAIHDDYVEPFIEESPVGQKTVHIPIVIDIEAYLAASQQLSAEEKSAILALWYDESLSRTYSRESFGVVVAVKVEESPSKAPRP